MISAPVVNISNNEATLSNPESFIWEAIYVMSSDDSEGIIPFEIEDFIDTRGNPAAGANSTYDGSSVLFDKTKPELTQVELVTNNDWNENWAKSGEKGLINISSSEDLLTLDLTINSNNVAENWVDPRTINHEYIFSDLDEEGVVVFELVFSDSAGNDGDIVVSTTNDSYIIFDKTAPEDFTLGTVSSEGGNEVASFWNSTNTELSVTVPIDNDTTLNNGRVQILVKIGEREFEELGEQFIIESDEVGLSKIISFQDNTIRSITGFDQGAIITTSAIVFDIPGNQKNGLESENLITIEEVSPNITHVSYKSE